MKTEISSLPC